jgi:hypothetical protein
MGDTHGVCEYHGVHNSVMLFTDRRAESGPSHALDIDWVNAGLGLQTKLCQAPPLLHHGWRMVAGQVTGIGVEVSLEAGAQGSGAAASQLVVRRG